ncbi:MAG: hypothetical protein EHM70_13560 [Chloroflexota bacterium]|nr:MAG: hypothetical protein EHM70_13560 [Chloroflexota bacterium]
MPPTQQHRKHHRLYRSLHWALLLAFFSTGVMACLAQLPVLQPELPVTGPLEEGQVTPPEATPQAGLPLSTLESPQGRAPNRSVQDEAPGTPPLSSTPTAALASPTPTIELPTPDPWTGKDRVTILILGLDYADWESDERVGPPRSDTMILLTFDPASKTAGMLSIPRDLWVNIPGMIRPNKINTAHRFGELYRLPGGGPGLAMKTVSQLLGVPVDYYARIDFSAFERFVDELGGVEIDVPAEIKVDPIGPHNTTVLKPGKQLLDGPLVLAYARNRYTSGDDFDRSRRQQQVIMAIRNRILNLDMLPMLVYKAPRLYSEMSSGIQTNLTLDQGIRMAWLASQIAPENIQSAIIGPNQVTYDTSEDGQSIAVPIPERIRFLVGQVFGEEH